MFPSTEAHTWGMGKPAQGHGHLQVQVEPLSAHLLPGRMLHLHEMLHFCRITWQPGASARCGHLLSCLRFLSHLVLCCGDGTHGLNPAFPSPSPSVGI